MLKRENRINSQRNPSRLGGDTGKEGIVGVLLCIRKPLGISGCPDMLCYLLEGLLPPLAMAC